MSPPALTIISFFLSVIFKYPSFVSGGGALDQEIGEFLNSIGLPTLQGYGLTETSPVVSCNPIHKIRVETVGPPFKGNQVKIANDGEILVKGENVMLGYWNKKEETENVIINGWASYWRYWRDRSK